MTGGCWWWLGAINADGYGTLKVDGETVYAHRFAFEATYGPIPPDQEISHACDNPSCVRPDHLHLGSHADNMHEMKLRGRARNGSTSHSPEAVATPANGSRASAKTRLLTPTESTGANKLKAA